MQATARKKGIAYLYDGTKAGMLTCIFESYARHETPAAILPAWEAMSIPFSALSISSDREKARRVLQGMTRRAGSASAQLIELIHLTSLPERELCALSFTRLAMKIGPDVMNMLSDLRVNRPIQAVRCLQSEAWKISASMHFDDVNGTSLAFINPRNNVLPLLDAHVSTCREGQRLIVFDRTHRMALMRMMNESRILRLDGLKRAPVSGNDLNIPLLWRRFRECVAMQMITENEGEQALPFVC